MWRWIQFDHHCGSFTVNFQLVRLVILVQVVFFKVVVGFIQFTLGFIKLGLFNFQLG